MTHPPIFYKYASSTTGLINLKTFKLRWSDPSTFNDTAEFQRIPCFEPTAAEAQRMLPKVLVEAAQGERQLDEERLISPLRVIQLAEARRQITSGISESDVIKNLSEKIPENPDADNKITDLLATAYDKARLETTRVLCVTTDFNNQVMWGNYAENHRGLVLGFRHLEDRSTPLLSADQVTYTNKPLIVGSGLDFLLYGSSPQLNKNTRLAITCSKTEEWAYEKEWRAITHRPEESGSQHGDYLFYPQELESITLGVRSSSELELEVVAIVKKDYKNCTVYRMQSDRGMLSRHIVKSFHAAE